MTSLRIFSTAAMFLAAMAMPAYAQSDAAPKHPLVWDAMEKTIDAKPGDGAGAFAFHVTNKGAQPVSILDARPSCSCTIAELPSVPWKLAPGAGGDITGTITFDGKDGSLTKSIALTTTAGMQTLRITVNIPQPDEARRERNRQMAAANRQAVFHGECATCHVVPLAGKTGGELFLAGCVICHQPTHRASMVPDLMVAREHRDAAYWTKWITEGREGSLMPAFAAVHGGPLSQAQIDSLVEFLLKQLPTAPRPKS